MAKLDELTEKFSTSNDPQAFNEFMQTLEKSMIMMPVMVPPEMEPAIKEAARQGKPFQMPAGSKPNIRILPLKDGKMAIPVFTSIEQVPEDKRTPMLTVPFKAAVDLAKAPGSNATQIIVNPFSKGVILREELIDVAHKRLNALAGNQGQGQTVQLTEKQVHTLIHTKVAREGLPKKFFQDTEAAFSELRLHKEKVLLDLYRSQYPEQLHCPYDEDDFSIMNLQIEEGLIITRIDLPEANKEVGSPLRIYIARRGEELHYYIIEKGEKGTPGNIAEITADGTHEIVSAAPDNGVEIETIMGLANPS